MSQRKIAKVQEKTKKQENNLQRKKDRGFIKWCRITKKYAKQRYQSTLGRGTTTS